MQKGSPFRGTLFAYLLTTSMNSPGNIKKVFITFEKNYKVIPLEKFGKNPYKVLVSTILSSRTKDEVTYKVCKEKLFIKADNFQALSKLNPKTIEKLIYPVGFYKVKARNLNKLAKTILTKYKGKVPNTREKLTTLPGVGRKTANIVLNRAFGIPTIAVDTHVHRISNMLGWVKTKTPEKTEAELEKILPKKYWSLVNKLFVSIGQQYRSQSQLKRFLEEKRLLTDI